MPRWLTAPYRLLWGVVLDCTGLRNDMPPAGSWPSTTPTVQEDSDEVGYYR